MKKLISIVIIMIFMMGIVYAETPAEVTIILNGEEAVLEVPPYIVNGRTMVPVRFLFEPLGLEVSWDSENAIATGERENLIIDLPIGSLEATVNGNIVVMDSAAIIKHDRTYVPLRFVAETTGAVVGWDEATKVITIDGGLGSVQEKSTAELLKAVYEDTNDFNGPNYLNNRATYQMIVDQMLKVKDDYLALNETFKVDLIKIADTLNISYSPETSLIEMLVTVNNLILPLHELDTEKLHLVSYDGYYTHHYDYGYYYGYYHNYEATGYKFGYTTFEGGYVLSFVPYEHDKRKGVGFKAIYNTDDSLRYTAYFTLDDDQLTGVDYTRYTGGIEAFDQGSVVDDVIMRIEEDGTIFIPPTDVEGISFLSNTGVGFQRFENQVEYVGYFDQWDRLGEGLYFAEEDDNSLSGNLVDLRAEEILEQVLTDELTEEQKIKNIHDYLVSHIIYDTNEDANGKFVSSSHTAYGALINGVAVCDGYSEAFKYLLDKSNIENVLIFGEGDDEGPPFEKIINHAWNLVNLGGVYFHYDLTWNDDDASQKTYYTYYKKNSEYFDDTHWWDPNRYSVYLD